MDILSKMAPVEGSCHGRRRVSIALLAAASGVAVSLTTISAQAPVGPTSVIDGYISDAELTPIADASVSLLGRSAHITTRENGRFRITGLSAGTYVVVANRLGYTPATVRIDLAPGDTARPSIALEHNAPMLDTMKVVAANRPSARMSEFLERRKLGIGQSMNADEINRRNSPWPKELLRTFLGVRFNNDAIAMNARAGIMRDCPYKYFIDGVAIPTPKDINGEMPSTRDLAGIEVFSSAASVPSQYAVNGAFCGVILFWTKDGSPSSEP